jgi:hypothetical protein
MSAEDRSLGQCGMCWQNCLRSFRLRISTFSTSRCKMLEIFSPGRMSLLFQCNGNFIYVTWILMLHTTSTFSKLRVSGIGLSLPLCVYIMHCAEWILHSARYKHTTERNKIRSHSTENFINDIYTPKSIL